MTFVNVYRAQNETEASMVRDFLEDNGIAGKLSSQLPAAVYGLSMQNVDVQVAEADKERALELIEAYFSASAEIDESEFPDGSEPE